LRRTPLILPPFLSFSVGMEAEASSVEPCILMSAFVVIWGRREKQLHIHKAIVIRHWSSIIDILNVIETISIVTDQSEN
jgi:hypothetical protein